MKKTIFTLVIVLVFLVGLSVMLYPYVADYFNSIRQSRVVAQYYRDLETLTQEDFSELFAVARVYNEKLIRKTNRFILTDEEIEEYQRLLNPFGNGIMGTLIIDAIDVRLPIYHGTDAGVLQIGAGHFEGTSLPIGGPGTHAVITGHRGLPTATLLTKLDRMAIGDTFVLDVLNETMTYMVDQILVVEPYEMDALVIEAGKDMCTLITCTPYGINSHRMLVRGQRTANAEQTGGDPVYLAEISDANIIAAVIVGAFMAIPALVAVAVVLCVRLHRILYRSKK